MTWIKLNPEEAIQINDSCSGLGVTCQMEGYSTDALINGRRVELKQFTGEIAKEQACGLVEHILERIEEGDTVVDISDW